MESLPVFHPLTWGRAAPRVVSPVVLREGGVLVLPLLVAWKPLCFPLVESVSKIPSGDGVVFGGGY